MKKKIIGMILTYSMYLAVFSKSEQVEIKIKDAIETQEIEAAKTVILSTEELSSLYSYKNDYNTDTCLNLSVADATRLMKIAVVEDNTSVESQAAIMQAVLNRVKSPEFPNSVEEVIRQKDSNGKYQFSTVANGKYDKAEPDVNSHLALAKVEKREIDFESLFFEAEWAKDTWQSNTLEYETTIGGTRFYKLP